MDQHEPLRGASVVNDELEVGFDEKFEIFWSRLEQFGRLVMCLVVAAGLAGILGAGPLDHARCGAPGQGAADYQPIARFGTATLVTLHLPPTVTDGQVIVTLSSSFVEPFGLASLHPEPLSQRTVRGDLQYTFAERGGGLDNYVRLSGMPAQIGPIRFVVEMPGRTLRFRTFILP